MIKYNWLALFNPADQANKAPTPGGRDFLPQRIGEITGEVTIKAHILSRTIPTIFGIMTI